MGQLRDKRIVQERIWLDPNQVPIPPWDYDFSYPITVYEAVKQTMDDNSPNLQDELDGIYRLINGKQNIIDSGVPGNVMTWTGVRGNIGTMEILKSISSNPSSRSHQKLVSERAIGDILDTKVTMSAYIMHVNDNSIHISDIERIRWNSMAPLSSLQAHIGNITMHITEEERRRWTQKADQTVVDAHIYDINNPHNVTAHQTGAYTRREVDEMFENIRESFFNYINIKWDERTNQAELVEYHPANWNPNYVLGFDDVLPDVPDPNFTYFALKPATNYENEETQDCIIYCKRPGLTWQEVGFQSMGVGDMVIQYPDTNMYIWVQGRFLKLFTGNHDSDLPTSGSSSDMMWRPSINEDGVLVWVRSKETEPPEPMIIKGADGYTPQKGIDYVDGKDGQGVPAGGIAGELLVKFTDDNYDTTWKNILDILGDIVLAGGSLPENVITWECIKDRPNLYDELGDNTDGSITQREITHQFEVTNNSIAEIKEKLYNPSNGIDSIKQDLYDHINDFNNPHRVTATSIGAVPLVSFNDHVHNTNNPHCVTPSIIGLGNVDNTSDIDKPISKATQDAIDEISNKFEVITGDISKFNYICNVTWTGNSTTLTFEFRDGSEINLELPITEVFNSIYFDSTEKELVIVLPDGTEHRINVATLIKTYFGSVSDNIQVVIEDDNIIKATVVPGSIGETEIAVSCHFRGSPTTTTQPVSDKSTRIATTEFVKNQVIDDLISYETDRPLSANMGRILNQRKVNIDDIVEILNDIEGIDVIDSLDSTNPNAALSANMGRHLDLTKAPRVHTSPSGSTFGRATIGLFGHVRASDVDPLMDGTVFRGTDDGYFARADHRHPTDVTRAPMHWPDEAHNQYELTGEPRAVIAPDDSNDNRIATTEWVRRNAVGVSFGACTSAAVTATKIVTLSSTYVSDPVPFILQKGSTIVVTFTNANTASDMKMNVQNTGAYPVMYGDKAIIDDMIKAGYSYSFTFDGTNWLLQNPTGVHTLDDADYSNSLVSSEWVRRNAVGVSHGKCVTSGNSSNKVATLRSTYMEDPVFIRQIGSTVNITFSEDDTSANPTLDIHGSGSSQITFGGINIIPGMIKANHTYTLTFDGTNWCILNPSGIHQLPDDDNSNSLVSSEWVRRNAVGSYHGRCESYGYENVKIVTLESSCMDDPVFIKQIGSTISVTFLEDNVITNDVSMNVHGTGESPILFGGVSLSEGMIKGGYTYLFTYDGFNWNLLNPSGIHQLPDDDNSNSLVSSEWVRRNAVGVSHGICSTDSSAAIKKATLISDFMADPVFIRQSGSTVVISFDNEDTCQTVTYLDVQNTGNAPVKFGSVDIIPGMIAANHSHIFTFDGTNWCILNPAAFETPKNGDSSNLPATTEWVQNNAISILYGECNTLGSKGDKVVTLKSSTGAIVESFDRKVGTTIAVTFKYEDKSGTSNPTTLNVHGTGAARVIFAGTTVVNGLIGRKYTHMFTFDGTYWRLINPADSDLWGDGGITIGPGVVPDPDDPDDEIEDQDNTVINRNSGYSGITVQGDGDTDSNGRVNRVLIALTFSPKNNELQIQFSEWEGAFSVKMGNNTNIIVRNPIVVEKTETTALIQFTMDSYYASNSPCQLIYRTNNAWINIKEI